MVTKALGVAELQMQITALGGEIDVLRQQVDTQARELASLKVTVALHSHELVQKGVGGR